MKKVFVDTNVMIDLLAHRHPFYEDAAKLFSLADMKLCCIVVASFSFATCAYVMRKVGTEVLKSILCDFSSLVEITGLNRDVVLRSISVDCTFEDIEDAMQQFSAVDAGCDVIVTRNKDDFENSVIQVMTPAEFIYNFGKPTAGK